MASHGPSQAESGTGDDVRQSRHRSRISRCCQPRADRQLEDFKLIECRIMRRCASPFSPQALALPVAGLRGPGCSEGDIIAISHGAECSTCDSRADSVLLRNLARSSLQTDDNVCSSELTSNLNVTPKTLPRCLCFDVGLCMIIASGMLSSTSAGRLSELDGADSTVLQPNQH